MIQIVPANVFAHADGLVDFTRGVAACLAPDGIFAIECPYLVDFIEQSEFDTAYHEHVSYIGLTPLAGLMKAHGLELYDVEYFPEIHGGTIRSYIARAGERKPACGSANGGECMARTFEFIEKLATHLTPFRRRIRAATVLNGALEMQSRLQQTVPIYQETEAAHQNLAKDGFISRLAMLDKTRERIEKEQELKAQTHQVASLKATIEQSRKRLAQITSAYRQQLQNERSEADTQRLRLEQEAGKQAYKHGLLELKAPHDGVVKDLATHTSGTVVSPGTILMTLVPHDDPVKAEVWVTNEDAGWVEVDQPVKLKLAAFAFNKYGMAKGHVEYVSPDAAELPDTRERDRKDTREHVMPPSGFRTLVALDSPYLEADGKRYRLTAGMLVSAEVNLGSRTVMEYLLSPVQKVTHEAGREK